MGNLLKLKKWLLSLFGMKVVGYNLEKYFKDEWLFYKDVDFANKDIMQYHLDTRDFHCSFDNGLSDKLPDINKLLKHGKEFFYTNDEVISLLDRYYKESKGRKEWRMFSLKGYGGGWELKYIRIFRTDHGLIVCNKDFYALRRAVTDRSVNIDLL